MKIISSKIPDVKILVPKKFNDKRGFFYESFNEKEFQEIIGEKIIFVQDNHSKSKRGVIRGLHYQKAPLEQGKLVRVVSGKKWFGVKLSSKNMRQLWIPEGFAHGFQVISKEAEVLYKTTNYYSAQHERTLKWDDSFFNIKWNKDLKPLLSKKDKNGQKFCT